jgi:hypothetical protein
MLARSIFCSLALCAALCGPGAAETKSLDDLVLVNVNGQEITRRHLVARLMEDRGEDSLEKMINRYLVFREAKRLKLSVTDAELDTRLKELQGKFNSEDDFQGFLKRSRLTEEKLRDETRNTLLLQKIVLHDSPISDEELVQYDARMATAEDQATAQKWIAELDGGGDFALIAGRSVDASLKQSGGRLKPFLRFEMLDVSAAIEDQKLKQGQYTKAPVKLAEKKWAVVLLQRRIFVGPGTSLVERERLSASALAYRVDQWLQRVRGKAAVQRKPLTGAVVATVDGEPLQRDQLVARLLDYQGEETLEQMVNRTLLLQAAKKLSVAVTDEEADKRLADAKAQFKDNPELYQGFLTRSGLTERQLRDELRFTALLERVVLKESPVTETDLQRYDIRMLTAPTRAVALKWIKELDEGGDFAQMAKERLADPQAREAGGRLKPFMKTDILDVWRIIDEQKLKPGMYSKIPTTLTDGSWVIIKLERVIPVADATQLERTLMEKLVLRYRMNIWPEQTRAHARIAYPVPLAAVIGAR